MSISDIERKGRARRTWIIYLLISVFCAVFGGVYEMFSHGVYSIYMMGAFIIPLIGGFLPSLIFCFVPECKYPNAFSQNLYHSGVAALTVGSIIRGALEIYGTTNVLLMVYPIVGTALILLGLTLYILIPMKE